MQAGLGASIDRAKAETEDQPPHSGEEDSGDEPWNPTQYDWKGNPDVFNALYKREEPQPDAGDSDDIMMPGLHLQKGVQLSFACNDKSMQLACCDQLSFEDKVKLVCKAAVMVAATEAPNKEALVNVVLDGLVAVLPTFKGDLPLNPDCGGAAKVAAKADEFEEFMAAIAPSSESDEEADKQLEDWKASDPDLVEAVKVRQKFGPLRFLKSQVKRGPFSDATLRRCIKKGIIPAEAVVLETPNCKQIRLRDGYEPYVYAAGIKPRRKGWTRRHRKG